MEVNMQGCVAQVWKVSADEDDEIMDEDSLLSEKVPYNTMFPKFGE